MHAPYLAITSGIYLRPVNPKVCASTFEEGLIDRTDCPKDSAKHRQLSAHLGCVHATIAELEGMCMRSPDPPEIVIAAALVACVACAVYNWLHRKRGKSVT